MRRMDREESLPRVASGRCWPSGANCRPRAWAYEMKWDGIRAIAHRRRRRRDAVSRSGRDITGGIPNWRAWPRRRASTWSCSMARSWRSARNGWPSFEVLQQRMNIFAEPGQAAGRRGLGQLPGFRCAVSTANRCLTARTASAGSGLRPRPSKGRTGRRRRRSSGEPGAEVRGPPGRHSLEGIMAKRLESRYEPGKALSAWRKIKNVLRQEFVVGGWSPGEGSRASLIGSLLVGVQGSGRAGLRGPRRHRLQRPGAADADRAA